MGSGVSECVHAQVAELLPTAHRGRNAWADMAILCRHHSEMDMCAECLRKRKLPHQLRRNSSSFYEPAHDSIKVMTLHVSKGLEFLVVVALVGAERSPPRAKTSARKRGCSMWRPRGRRSGW